ncbi:MAG: MarC family protein [Actinomycetota bacterium]|nr:MarC family protein [Actinomycetota bacterium]
MSLSDFALNTTLIAQAFVTVLVIMDPLGNIPVFLTLTRGESMESRQRSALQAVAVAAGVILVFALFGQQILEMLGISLEALQVAGGLLLVLIALELLHPGEEDAAATRGRGQNVALVPLGTPMLAGPGAIAATMLAMQRAGTIGGVVSVVLALLGALGVVYLTMRYSGVIGNLLKDNGINLVSRVMGLLLAAIAVQLVASGVAEWVQGGVA